MPFAMPRRRAGSTSLALASFVVLSLAAGAANAAPDAKLLAAANAQQPAVIDTLKSLVTIESGSFFDSVPEGGDLYIVSHIIHDWSEEQCLTILGNIRKAMKPDGKLLIVEFVLPEGDTPHLGKLADIVMLVIPGGQERTADEYDELLGKAGFRMNRVVPTESPVSIVEAVIA